MSGPLDLRDIEARAAVSAQFQNDRWGSPLDRRLLLAEVGRLRAELARQAEQIRSTSAKPGHVHRFVGDTIPATCERCGEVNRLPTREEFRAAMSEPLDLEPIRARQRGRLPGVQLDISALLAEVERLRAELARRDEQITAVRAVVAESQRIGLSVSSNADVLAALDGAS